MNRRSFTMTLLLVLTALTAVACGSPVQDEIVEVVEPNATEEETADLVPTSTAAPETESEEIVAASEANEEAIEPEPDGSTNSIPSAYYDSYAISDTGFGTEVSVTVDEAGKTRTIVANALPNHDVGEFPNEGNPNTISEQDNTYSFRTDPVYAGVPTRASVPGVAINGVKFQPNTAERVNCENGEVYSIEAITIQMLVGPGLDFNNAHVQPWGEYHYHGASELLAEVFDNDQDLVHVAFAADGHMIYYSKSGAYSTSYRLGTGERAGTNCAHTGGGPNNDTVEFGPTKDGTVTSDWDFDPSYGDLDQCNGITVNGEYIYLITQDYPYISRCLMGEYTEVGPGAGGDRGGEGAPAREGGQGGGRQGGQGGGQGARPDFAGAAEILGITEDALREAAGPPPHDFEAAADSLGITLEDLQNALEER